MKQKIGSLLIVMLCVLLLAGCGGMPDTNHSSVRVESFMATIVEIGENTIIVEPFSEEEVRKSADQIVISKEEMNWPENTPMSVGMAVVVEYNGVVLETWPGKLQKVYSVGPVTEETEE